MTITSHNTVFTHRAIRPSVRLRDFEAAGSGGQPCEPNRVATAPLGLKVLGFVNTQNVIGILCNLSQGGFSVGTKFGNIHVITNDKNEVLSALKNISSGKSQNIFSHEMLSGFESLLEGLNHSKNIYYLGELRPGLISVLNDSFGWGEVEVFGEELSSYINSPILTISYFDDDLFEMNLYLNGEQQTGHLWCSDETKETYELEEKQADISILSEYLGHQHINKLNEILNIDECEQAIEELQNLLQIPLWIKSDWFDDIDDKELINKYEKHDLNN
jgi:hypothetical protein